MQLHHPQLRQQQQQQQAAYASLAAARRQRVPRAGRDDDASFSLSLLKRCLPCLAWRRLRVRGRSPRARRLAYLVLALLTATLAFLVGLLCYLLWTSDALVPGAEKGGAEAEVQVPVQPTTVVPPREQLGQRDLFDPGLAARAKKKAEEEALARTWRARRIPITYWDIEGRSTPPLTMEALQAWFTHAQQGQSAAAEAADVPEEVVTQHAWGRPPTDAAAAAHTAPSQADEADFFDALAFLFPPQQQRQYYRDAMNAILRHGTRVGGTRRDALLAHLVDEGLGRRRYDAQGRRLRDGHAPHLSPRGRALLETAAASASDAWPTVPPLLAAPDADRVPGWRWSLSWDNFTANIPVLIDNVPRAAMQNLVFQFPGGSQFRRKWVSPAFVGEVHVNDTAPADARADVLPGEGVAADATGQRVYAQETMLRLANDTSILNRRPALERGVPGTRVALTPEAKGEKVPLKPSLSATDAPPVPRQPVKHVMLAAHWDSKHFDQFSFLGACDSAMPMVFLLRTIKNVAVLTDVAEALAASYAAERAAAATGTAGPATASVVPGRTHTFSSATTEAEVRGRLATLLSPAHHALLYQYFFARPYAAGDAAPPGGSRLPGAARPVDVRAWLDWAQHLPVISVALFDGEEAFAEWRDEDNTYGSRHLARRWRDTAATTRTAFSNGAQSLYDSLDLFALYDLMGPAGTTFSNMFPTQSGIFFAGLAQRETDMRQRALHFATSIAAELLWRHHGRRGEDSGANATGTATADGFLRQLNPSPAEAVASINPAYARQLLASPASRPSAAALPRTWLMYGAPHELHTLHGLPRVAYDVLFADHFEQLRTYDKLARAAATRDDFDAVTYLRGANFNIFFDPTMARDPRRGTSTHLADDDHEHWLDTQRVLHLIAMPFPRSWHKAADDGRDIHDGTAVDLGRLLWSEVLELGDYWTRTA